MTAWKISLISLIFLSNTQKIKTCYHAVLCSTSPQNKKPCCQVWQLNFYKEGPHAEPIMVLSRHTGIQLVCVGTVITTACWELGSTGFLSFRISHFCFTHPRSNQMFIGIPIYDSVLQTDIFPDFSLNGASIHICKLAWIQNPNGNGFGVVKSRINLT